MTKSPVRYEFRVLDRFKASDVQQLSDMSAQGWEVAGFDWADHGHEGAILLRRAARVP